MRFQQTTKLPLCAGLILATTATAAAVVRRDPKGGGGEGERGSPIDSTTTDFGGSIYTDSDGTSPYGGDGGGSIYTDSDNSGSGGSDFFDFDDDFFGDDGFFGGSSSGKDDHDHDHDHGCCGGHHGDHDHGILDDWPSYPPYHDYSHPYGGYGHGGFDWGHHDESRVSSSGDGRHGKESGASAVVRPGCLSLVMGVCLGVVVLFV